MEDEHYAVWRRCREFVEKECAGRDPTHGLDHMSKVTEEAILLYLMDAKAECGEQAISLFLIIAVGMLHDVADHKYDKDGQLQNRVDAFVRDTAKGLVELVDSHCNPLFTRSALDGWFTATVDGEGRAVSAVESIARSMLLALGAISYSVENKRGMRWFEKELPRAWVRVRDYVSDADKLEAIGEDGLVRCYEYACAVRKEKAAQARVTTTTIAMTTAPSSAPTAVSDRQERIAEAERVLLQHVCEHYDEKLNRLLPLFMVTRAGKFLGQPRHEAMARVLEEWKRHGPPSVTQYWPEAATEFA